MEALAIRLDPPEPALWRVGGEAWTEYVEHGPYEVLKVLQRTIKQRAAHDAANLQPPSGGSDALASNQSSGLKPRHRSVSAVNPRLSDAPLLRSLSFAAEPPPISSGAALDRQACSLMRLRLQPTC